MTTPEAVDERIEELRERTALSPREAKVQAGKEQGYTHKQIAERLELDKSTVDEYSRRVQGKHEKAVRTIREVDVDAIQARCLSCGKDVEDEPVLADYPVCETCFRQLWSYWFERRVRMNIPRGEVNRMVDKRVNFLNDVNQALIKEMAMDLSGAQGLEDVD